jgi:heptosyltransferase-2
MSNKQRRYLVVGPSWVGDMVMAQSLFITLKQLYPGCIIDVVSPDWSLPLLERMPEVRNGISLPVLHGQFSLLTRIKKGLSLRGKQYTHAIVIPRSWKSALVPFFARVPVKTGYRGEMRYGLLNDIRKLDKQMLTQTVQRYVAHAYDAAITGPPDVPYPELRIDEPNRDKVLGDLGLDLEKPVIAMMPGAEYGPAKQWPVEKYAELAGQLVNKGYQVWVIGSSKEEDLGQKIIDGLTASAFNLCGKTSLVDVVDLLSCAEQVVTNDSGLMHVAAAVGVKVNVIYGSSTPAYTPPLADEASIFYKDLQCSPCFDRVCKFGHYDCLSMIEVQEVADAIKNSEQ